MARNKTDANDADGLVHLAEVGFYRESRVNGFERMLTRTLMGARLWLTRMSMQLSNQIRGVMKTFGLLVPVGKRSKFNRNVRKLLGNRGDLAAIVLPLLEAWQTLCEQVARPDPSRTTTAGLPPAHVDPRRRPDHSHVVCCRN